MSSIRIVPQNDVATTAGVIPPLLFANLKTLYHHRATRLRKLAETYTVLSDYLLFAAQVVDAQQVALKQYPLQIDLTDAVVLSAKTNQPPLSAKTFPRLPHWRQLLSTIISELKPKVTEPISAVLETLEKSSTAELEAFADALLQEKFNQVGADKAPFIWAALSLYWVQMATQLPGQVQAELGEHRQFCPVCESSPVASIIQIGTDSGLRYLHCGLCESEWHMVRIKCSNCEESRDLNYWSLDSEHSAIKAESCDNCKSYLKIFYQEKEPYLELIADDLASLVLDAKMEETGYARTSFNPFLFPSE